MIFSLTRHCEPEAKQSSLWISVLLDRFVPLPSRLMAAPRYDEFA
jgi:hypothetical protein